MTTNTAGEMYEAIKSLSAQERLRLVEMIVHDLSEGALESQPAQTRPRWSELAGVEPGLLEGQDAQDWVTRGRHQGGESRETALRIKR